jgi:hypothetical protein
MFTTRLTVQAARSCSRFNVNVNVVRSFTSTTPVLGDQYDVVIIGTYLISFDFAS